MHAPRVPPNLFGIAFGLTGLAGTWRAAGAAGRAPTWVAEGLLVLAAAVWLVLVGLYLWHAVEVPGALRAGVLDPAAGPFTSLAVITPMLLAAEGLAPVAPGAAVVVVDVFLVLTVLLGAWFTGQWMHGTLRFEQLHPGYYLPTVAGGLVASAAAAMTGQRTLAMVAFGLGACSWLLVGSLLLARLFLRPELPAPLLPTHAIQVAPPAVAALAWFTLDGNRIDTVAAVLSGYALLIALAQLRLLPAFARLAFSAGFWAFTFSWAAAGTLALHWIEAGPPAAAPILSGAVLVAVTGLVGGIAVRTVIALRRGALLAPPAPVLAGGAG